MRLTLPLGKQVLGLDLPISAHLTLSKLDCRYSFITCRRQMNDINVSVSEILTRFRYHMVQLSRAGEPFMVEHFEGLDKFCSLHQARSLH